MDFDALHRQLIVFRRDWSLKDLLDLVGVITGTHVREEMKVAAVAVARERRPDVTWHISLYPVKMAEILRAAPLRDDPYHRAIKAGAENLCSRGFFKARYLSQNGGSTLWDLGDGRKGRLNPEGFLDLS